MAPLGLNRFWGNTLMWSSQLVGQSGLTDGRGGFGFNRRSCRRCHVAGLSRWVFRFCLGIKFLQHLRDIFLGFLKLTIAQQRSGHGFQRLSIDSGLLLALGLLPGLPKIPFIALETDSEQLEVMRRFGNRVYYGDPARPDLLRAAGCEVEEFDDALRITRTGELKPLKLKTMPHPGFPTDMQPLMTALLTLAKGTSIVTEGIWENRFRYVDELIHMGANIQVDSQVAVIEGVKELHPAPLRATDLRAGAAMVMAALAANGVSEVDETIHIERGYENIVEKLQALGADIRRVEIPANAVSRAI